MAKLKAPLLSFSASGKIADAIVYFTWKGLEVARQYVVPSNPRSSGQVAQRSYLTDVVAAIHAAQAAAIGPLVEGDTMAYALWGSIFATPRTWFNQACKNWIDSVIAGNTPTVYRAGVSQPGASLLHPSIQSDEIDGSDITAGKFYYGTSKTALIHSVVATITDPIHQASKEISGLTAGIKYYWQFRPDTGENCQGAWSGIYHGTPTA